MRADVLLSLQETALDAFLDNPAGGFPEHVRCMGDRGFPGEHIVTGDPGRMPGSTAGEEIVQQRLQTVHGAGEFRLRRPPGFELVPQRAELMCLLARQEPEDPVGGDFLAILLLQRCGGVVGSGPIKSLAKADVG